MLGTLRKAFTAIKEGAVEAGAKSYLNQKIQAFGTVTDLKIDTAQKTLVIQAELQGETSPVQVRVLQYEVTGSGPHFFVIARRFEASRPRLHTALNTYLP